MNLKHVFLIATLFLSAQVFAQNIETIPFNGQTNFVAELFGEKTHTEYRAEQQPDTCSRQVFSHYENVCHNIPQQHCSSEPRRTCRTVAGACRTFQGQCRTHCNVVRGQRRCNRVCPPPQRRCEPSRQVCSTTNERVCRTTYRQECNQEARYRTEYYSCTRTVQIPYEVFDYNIEAKVDIAVTNLPQDREINEMLSVELKGEDIELKLSQNNAPLVAVLSAIKKHEALEGQIKTIHFEVELEVYTPEEIQKDMEEVVENISYVGDQLIMTLNKTQITEFDSVHLALTQDRFLFRNRALYDKVIPQNALESLDEGEKIILKVNIPQLVNRELRSRKHYFELNFSYRLGEGLITPNQNLIRLNIKKSMTIKP